MPSSRQNLSVRSRRSSSPISPKSSIHREGGSYTDVMPSLRQSYLSSSVTEHHDSPNTWSQNMTHAVNDNGTGLVPPHGNDTTSTRDFAATNVEADMDEPSRDQLDERTKLLENYSHGHDCGHDHCDHGTFSPQPTHARAISLESKYSFGGRHDGEGEGSSRISTTQYLTRTHGISNPRAMYVDVCFSS